VRRLAAAAAAVALLAAPAATAAEPVVPVRIDFQAFSPSSIDVLPGETVEWRNGSERRHTVTADDGSFDSGDVLSGLRFKHRFDAVGAYRYHCRVHTVMTGEVDVRRVTLGPLPPGLVRTGEQVDVEGRTADPSTPVRVQRSTGGAFTTVATATPDADGDWTARVTAKHTADYRAASGSDVSEARELRVSDRTVKVHRTKRGLAVQVTPYEPYARVVLELKKRERFGWWPAKRRKLDYLSEASFKVRGPAAARVELVDDDGWTALAVSRTVRIARPR
jgi:plastocyanin